MNRSLAKRGRKRLPPEAYQELWKKVLRRDGWRCQSCGGSKDLQVHHIEARSHLGDDSEQNLITLCVDCHRWIHGTAENWKTLEHRDTLPKKIREAIKRQILGVAAAVKKQ